MQMNKKQATRSCTDCLKLGFYIPPKYSFTKQLKHLKSQKSSHIVLMRSNLQKRTVPTDPAM